jgi:hypothetical protein
MGTEMHPFRPDNPRQEFHRRKSTMGESDIRSPSDAEKRTFSDCGMPS